MNVEPDSFLPQISCCFLQLDMRCKMLSNQIDGVLNVCIGIDDEEKYGK